MKKSLLSICLLAAFAAQAQTSNIDSSAQSGAQSGSQSTSGAAAYGNVNASESNSASGSRADSGSVSGAYGNSVVVDQRGPTSQTVNQTLNGTTNINSRAESILNGHTTEDVNVHNSGTSRVENVTSGSLTTNQNVHYSGTQTVKNVPSIAMSGPASGPCTGASGGLGLAGPGWGLGLNGSSVMVDCRLRENTRVLGMAMQSLDGATYPQERGEVTVLFMDAVRALAAYNRQIAGEEIKQPKQ